MMQIRYLGREQMKRYTMRFPLPAAIAAISLAATGAWAAVSVGISINVAPPPLPIYVQPPVPAPGYIWTPGYWAWGDGDYYWVPGTWVAPPEVGFLWTPGYWGWGDGVYLWHAGYWGPHVGFYGGVNYGYGYTGNGFEGGYWRARTFYYNRSVANVRTANIRTVYNKTVVHNVTVNRVSYNGGKGGLGARPSAAQEAADRDHHMGFTPDQERHEHLAAGDRQLRQSVNHGRPAVAATARPAEFSGRGVMPARAPATRNTAHEVAHVSHPGEPHVNQPVTQRAPNAAVQQHQMPNRPQGGDNHGGENHGGDGHGGSHAERGRPSADHRGGAGPGERPQGNEERRNN